MRALVYKGAWQMPLQEVETPSVSATDVLVSVEAVGICGSDVHGFMGTTGRRKPPIIMGHEFSGVVRAAGEGVNRFREGDRVVVQPLLTCGGCVNCRAGLPHICLNRNGLGINMDGAYADYVRVPQQMIYHLPDDLTWEQGAMVEPLAVALHAVNLTPLQLLDTLVIVGSGTIGLLTLLAARLKGAGQIIVTDLNKHRLAKARALGADVTINVAEEDPIAVVHELTGGAGAHAVIEAVGMTPTVQQALALVRPGGNVTWIGNSDPEIVLNMQQVVTRELTIRGSYGFNQEFSRSLEAIHSGRIDVTPLIEKIAPLEEGPQIFYDLAKGQLDAVKVILKL